MSAPPDQRPAASPQRTGADASSATPGSLAVWVNGERHDPEGAHLSGRDRGLTLADGVFETMRLSNGRIFRLDRHLSRLTHALLALRIAAPPALRTWVLRAADQSNLADGCVRLTVTRGVGPAGLTPVLDSTPTVLVVTGPMPAYPAGTYASGLSAHVVSGRRNERAMTAGLKTLAYTDAIAGLLEAQRAGADEALFLDTEDHLSEATASNLFVWNGRTLVTPPLSCAALPGVTRAAVLELAYGLRLEVFDAEMGMDVLRSASEAFLTSSLRGIAPLVRVDGRPIGDGVPGPITTRIAQAYAALVERECR